MAPVGKGGGGDKPADETTGVMSSSELEKLAQKGKRQGVSPDTTQMMSQEQLTKLAQQGETVRPDQTTGMMSQEQLTKLAQQGGEAVRADQTTGMMSQQQLAELAAQGQQSLEMNIDATGETTNEVPRRPAKPADGQGLAEVTQPTPGKKGGLGKTTQPAPGRPRGATRPQTPGMGVTQPTTSKPASTRRPPSKETPSVPPTAVTQPIAAKKRAASPSAPTEQAERSLSVPKGSGGWDDDSATIDPLIWDDAPPAATGMTEPTATAAAVLADDRESQHDEDDRPPVAYANEPPTPRRELPIAPIAGAIAVLALLAVGGFLFLSGDKQPGTEGGSPLPPVAETKIDTEIVEDTTADEPAAIDESTEPPERTEVADVEQPVEPPTYEDTEVPAEPVPRWTALRFPVRFREGNARAARMPPAALNSAVRKLSGCPGRITATGHTSSTGTDEFNRQLGFLRANWVKSQLVDAGMDDARFDLRSAGKNQPIRTNNTPKGRERNRRVMLSCE